MGRRQKGSGGIREKRPSVYELKFDMGRDPFTGKRRTRYATVKGTRKEAEKELRKQLHEIDTGAFVETSKITVEKFLDRWIEHVRPPKIAPKTFERYGQLVLNNIVPALGSHSLSQLKAIHIDNAWSMLLREGRKDGRGGLAPQTVKHCHRLLKQALDQAVRWQLIGRNPADAVETPQVVRGTVNVLDAEQTITLLAAIQATPFYIPTLIAVMNGLRRGEVLALRWEHLDFDSGYMGVHQSLEQTKKGLRFKETKSKRPRRVLMPSLLAAELKKHRVKQAEELLMLGIRQTSETLVCCRHDGSPMDPENLSRQFPVAVAKAGLPRITFHTLRHSHATQMLSNGTHMKVASERLGHSSIGITMDLYSHILPGMQEEAAERVDNALRIALNDSVSST
jgi:integrase